MSALGVFSIVLTRMDEDYQATGDWTRFDGYNYKRKMVAKPKAIAAMWMRDATEEDLPRAREFAQGAGYDVVMVPRKEQDPLGYAKRKTMEKHNG